VRGVAAVCAQVDGVFSSAYWTGFFSGFMAIPALVGYLMTQLHAMCFAAAMFACALGMAAAYSLLHVVVANSHRIRV